MDKIISQSQLRYLKSRKRQHFCIIIMRTLILVLLIGGWELCADIGVLNSFVFSSPSRIIRCFTDMAGTGIIWKHLWVTVYETLICFSIVIAAGMLCAMLMWRFRMVFKIAEPYIVLLNSLPKSALAPVLIVWLGNNVKTIIVAAVSVAIFGAVLSIYTAFIETDPEKIKLIRTLGGKRRHILTKLVIPSSIPTIINTMKVNLGLSLVGVIIGELLAADSGLGYLIIYGSQVFKMDWVLMSIVILCILSGVLYKLINILEKKAGHSS